MLKEKIPLTTALYTSNHKRNTVCGSVFLHLYQLYQACIRHSIVQNSKLC